MKNHLVKMLITITMRLQVQVIIPIPKKGENENEKKKRRDNWWDFSIQTIDATDRFSFTMLPTKSWQDELLYPHTLSIWSALTQDPQNPPENKWKFELTHTLPGPVTLAGPIHNNSFNKQKDHCFKISDPTKGSDSFPIAWKPKIKIHEYPQLQNDAKW